MAKDFQDIQQLDSEDNDHELGGGEGPGPRGHNPRRGDRFCVGECPILGASLPLRLAAAGSLSLCGHIHLRPGAGLL